MATSAAPATKEWQKNQENEQLKKKVNLIAAQTANQQKEAQLNQGNPSALPSTTAVNVNGQQSLPSIPTSKPADPKAEMAKATAKAINTNPANNLEEPVNAATEKSANDAKIEGEEDNPIIPRPSQNDDVTKAQLGVNANEAAKGEKPTNVVNAPIGDDVFDSFSYEDRPSIKGRWNWNLEHSFMLPKSAWADEVRKNAQVENQMRAQDSAQWQMRRNQQNDLLNKKMAAQKANQPKQLSNASVRLMNGPVNDMNKVNTNLIKGLYGKLNDPSTMEKYGAELQRNRRQLDVYSELTGIPASDDQLYNLYGPNSDVVQQINKHQQQDEAVQQQFQNANDPQSMKAALDNMDKVADIQANDQVALERKYGIVSLTGDAAKKSANVQKSIKLAENAASMVDNINEWVKDPEQWEKKRGLLDPMGDYLTTRLGGENAGSMADAAKQRAQFMDASDDERAYALAELKAYSSYLSSVMSQAGKVLGTEEAANTAAMFGQASQDLTDYWNGGAYKTDEDGTKGAEAWSKFQRNAARGIAMIKQSGMFNAELGTSLAAAEKAHDNYWNAIMLAGAQNPRYLYGLAGALYKREKEFVDDYVKDQQGNPYDWRNINIPDDKTVDEMMKQWPVNEMFTNVPFYVKPEHLPKTTPVIPKDKGKGKGTTPRRNWKSKQGEN